MSARDSGGSNEQQTTAGVFDLPLGRYLVYGAGLAFLGAAAFNGYRAVTCKFNKKLKTGEMNDAEEAASTGVGILGHLARMIVFALIGVFLLRPRGSSTREEARGLDGALLEVSQQAYGGLLLGAVASRTDRPTRSTASSRRATAGSRRRALRVRRADAARAGSDDQLVVERPTSRSGS